AGGCTFDPFADDVSSFFVEVRDGEIWLCPRPIEEERRSHWTRKLEEGLEQNIRLLLAKGVIGLNELGGTKEIVREAALFGIRNRAGGWSSGLSILTATANSRSWARRTCRSPCIMDWSTSRARPATSLAPFTWGLSGPASVDRNVTSTGSVASSRFGRARRRSGPSGRPSISACHAKPSPR